MGPEASVLVGREVALHEEDAALLAQEAGVVRRRAELALALSKTKQEQAELETDAARANQLRFEADLCRRESHTLSNYATTLDTEQDRAEAYARVALQKA